MYYESYNTYDSFIFYNFNIYLVMYICNTLKIKILFINIIIINNVYKENLSLCEYAVQ